eukprot:5666383-Karenia_brevis.AAC.1
MMMMMMMIMMMPGSQSYPGCGSAQVAEEPRSQKCPGWSQKRPGCRGAQVAEEPRLQKFPDLGSCRSTFKR